MSGLGLQFGHCFPQGLHLAAAGLGLGLERFLPQSLYFLGWVIFLISIWRPCAGVYYVVPLLPLQTIRFRMHQFPLGSNILDIVLLGVIIGLYLANHGRPFPKTPMNRLLVIFIVFHYLSLWRGAFFLGGSLPIWITDQRFSEWKNYMEMPVIFFATVGAIKSSKQMKYLIVLMCLSVVMVNVAYRNTIQDRDYSHFSYEGRYAGALGYAGVNGFAAFEAQFSLFLLGLYAWEKRLYVKLGILAVLASSLYCLVFTFSRGAYGAFLVGLIFLGVLKKRSLLVLAVFLLVSWQTVTPPAVQERLKMTYESGEGLDGSSEERVNLWQDAMKVIVEKPVMGTGFDTYAFMGRVGEFRDTHNLYVKVLLEMGIIGIGLLLYLLFKSYQLGYSLSRYQLDPFLASLGLGFAAMMVCAMFVNVFGDRWTYIQINGYLWALMGCLARAHMLIEDRSQTVEEPARKALEESSNLRPVAIG